MKKILTFAFAFLLMIGFVNAEEKVKVYLFEAGGCPYCEKEEEYLKGLEGYNKTFEVIKKELYVDHVNWEQGKDYELGKATAEAFNKAGFEEASYEGTPFVVISDLYAAAAYSEDLETFINNAYSEGDKDAVSCIANNGTNCIRSSKTDTTSSKSNDSKAGIVVAILGGIALVGVVVYLLTKREDDMIEEDVVHEAKEEIEEVEVKEEIKEKKSKPTKKTTKKTNSKKTTKK